MSKMAFDLSDEDLGYLRARVRRGGYESESEVVSDALVLLRRLEESEIQRLRAAIREGETDIKAGRRTVIADETALDAFFETL